MKPHPGRLATVLCSLCLLMMAPRGTLAVAPASEKTTARPFFAFCFDMHDVNQRSLAEQALMLKQIGFDGAGHVGLEHVEQRIATLKAMNLKLFLAGMRVDLRQAPRVALDQLEAALPKLKNRDVLLYVVLTGLPTSDPAGTPQAVSLLREMARMAQPAGVRLGIYPHTNDWVARVDHAIQLTHQVDQENVGVIFNLCHYLRNEDPAELELVLKNTAPKLFAVTLNGAELAGKQDNDWKRLIQPLGSGDVDIAGLLAMLDRLGYEGPVGLMCYGLSGDAAEHLKQSMAAWKELH